MIAGARFVLWQRRAGILAMVLLVGALLALADALVGGLKGNQTAIELIPDSRFLISGPMPTKTEAIKDFIIDGQPADGSVRLVPDTIFTGYWFGGSMWRGAIVVDPFAREGSFVISVKDRFGENRTRPWCSMSGSGPTKLPSMPIQAPFSPEQPTAVRIFLPLAWFSAV
jgi:hypothetical protein